jgi:hypothetical protein
MIYQERNLKALNTLCPAAKLVFYPFYEHLDSIGKDILIVSAFRSAAEQDRLYAQGRTVPGLLPDKIVTWVKGGWSFHNFGCAIDFVPVTFFGLEWNARKSFLEIAEIAKQFGIEHPMPEIDVGHLQWSGGLTIKALRAGKEPEYINIAKPIQLSPDAKIRSLQRGIVRSSGNLRLSLEKQLSRLLNRMK